MKTCTDFKKDGSYIYNKTVKHDWIDKEMKLSWNSNAISVFRKVFFIVSSRVQYILSYNTQHHTFFHILVYKCKRGHVTRWEALLQTHDWSKKCPKCSAISFYPCNFRICPSPVDMSGTFPGHFKLRLNISVPIFR